MLTFIHVMISLSEVLATTPCSDVNIYDQLLLGKRFRIITNKGKVGKMNGSLRSIICSGGKIVSVGPPSSVFCDKSEFVEGGERVEEIVDGTMLNLFWYRGWHVASRSRVGGSNKFGECKLTFAQILRSVLGTDQQESHLYNVLESIRNEVPSGLLSVSFVLQHPLNRHVVPVHDTKLVLVGVSVIIGDSLQPFSCADLDRLANLLPSTIRRPRRFLVSAITDVDDILNEHGHEMKGLFSYKDSWNRKKILSPWYCEERERLLAQFGN